MSFNDDANLDTSQVESGGGRGVCPAAAWSSVAAPVASSC